MQKSWLKHWDSSCSSFQNIYKWFALFEFIGFIMLSAVVQNPMHINSIRCRRDFEMDFWMQHTDHKFDSCSPCYLRFIQFCFFFFILFHSHFALKKRSSRTRIDSMRPRYGFMWIAYEWYSAFVSQNNGIEISSDRVEKGQRWKIGKMCEKYDKRSIQYPSSHSVRPICFSIRNLEPIFPVHAM